METQDTAFPQKAELPQEPSSTEIAKREAWPAQISRKLMEKL